MKADLHFFPSFFNPEHKFHFTEPLGAPSLLKVVKEAEKKDIGILTITSCDDDRFKYYTRDEQLRGFENEGYLLVPDDRLIRVQTENKKSIYILNAQQVITMNDGRRIDINAIRIAERIPDRKSLDYALDAANEQKAVISVCNIDVRNGMTREEAERLYKDGKVHTLEVYKALDTKKNNRERKLWFEQRGIKGIAVSDGHRLKDMGLAGIVLDTEFAINELGVKLQQGDFENYEGQIIFGKALFYARLMNAIYLPKF